MIGYGLLVAHIFTLPNLLAGSMTRRRTSAHNMALDATGRGSTASLSEEEAMATYYIMERDHAQRDEELINGIYRHNIRNTQKGHPKAGSSQSICKYPHFFFFAVEGPTADATDTPQPWGLLCNPWWRWRERWPVFSLFQVKEQRWNETDRGKPKYSGENLSQCHFVNHKPHMDRPGIEAGHLRWEAGA
jgi:hypothetical protein